MTLVQQIDTLTREEAEIMAARICRELAKQAIQGGVSRRRNIVTATREASELSHLATVLEKFANA